MLYFQKQTFTFMNRIYFLFGLNSLLPATTLSTFTSKVFSRGGFISSPEPKALGELIGWDSSLCQSASLCIRAFTVSDMNNSETSWPIIIKFHRKHYWGGGLAALGFGPDRIRTLVSMATNSSHRVIMGKIL